MAKEFEGKKLLVIGGFTNACDIVIRAKEMGATVYVVDYNEQSPAIKYADYFALISCLDVDAVVAYCQSEGIEGVLTGFVDILLPAYMEICGRLGVPCYITPKMLSMSTNKVDFKDTCTSFGIPVPVTYLEAGRIPDELYDTIKYPVFVKPLDGSGSRGAGVCYNREQLDDRFGEAVSFSASKKAIIEDYITGKEFLLDYIAVDGEFRLLSMFDRHVTPDRGSAVNYSDISISPSNHVDTYLEKINGKVIDMFQKLGFKDGVLFMQGYSDGDKITFFEMGCRLGGSFYNHERKCIGFNALDMLIRFAFTGKMVDDINIVPADVSKYNGHYALDCNYLLKGKEGTVCAINGLEQVRQMPSCISTTVYHEEGYHFEKDRTVDRPILVAEIVCDSKEQVIRDVDYLNDVFDVLDENNNSMLYRKYNPRDLFKKKKLVVCGGGSSAHSLIPLLSDSIFDVSIYTSKPERWSPEVELEMHADDGQVHLFKGSLSRISNDPKDLFPDADYVVFCMPVHQYRVALNKVAPYLSRKKTVFIGTMYGQGGWNWMVDEIRNKFGYDNIVSFAFGLLPWICRIIEYGHKGVNYGGFKEVNSVAVFPKSYFDQINCEFFEQVCYKWFHKGQAELSESFISLSLSVDNQIIHTSRCFSLNKAYGQCWDRKEDVPYFYRDFDDLSAEMLGALDDDYSKVRNAIKALHPETEYKHMLDYLALERYSYKSDIADIKQSFLESTSLSAIATPVIQNEEGKWVIDKNHRFFLDDIYYGVCIAKWLAEKMSISTPTIDSILFWAQNVRNEKIIDENHRLVLSDDNLLYPMKSGIPSVYGYNSVEEVID